MLGIQQASEEQMYSGCNYKLEIVSIRRLILLLSLSLSLLRSRDASHFDIMHSGRNGNAFLKLFLPKHMLSIC